MSGCSVGVERHYTVGGVRVASEGDADRSGGVLQDGKMNYIPQE